MKILALDDNHDWVFGQGQADYREGLDCLVENLETRLLSWKGDCFFDTEAGLDYANLIGSFGKEIVDNFKKNCVQLIQQTEGVISVQSVEVEQLPETRQFFLTAYIITQYGNINFQQTL